MNRNPMPIDEDELPTQRPQVGRSTPPPSVVATPSARPTPAENPLDTAIRPDDAPAGEDRPIHKPKSIDVVSEENRQQIVARDLSLELQKMEEEILSEPAMGGIGGILATPLVGMLLLGAIGLVGLFLFNQFLSTAAAIANLPQVWQYAAWTALGVLTAMVLGSMLRFGVFYLRLKRNKQLRIEGLRELEKRTHLRWLVHARAAEAREQLEEYLTQYQLRLKTDRRALKKAGFAEEQMTVLAKTIDELLDAHRWASSQAWFTAFHEQFQTRIDAVAKARIDWWAKRMAIAVALSPNAVADTMMTLYGGFGMMNDLCRVYHLRASRFATGVILVRVFLNSYIAGQTGQLEDVAGEQISTLVEPHIHDLFAVKLAGKLGAKAATGTINYLLLLRLGKYAAGVLKPMK